jgi:uncharacterized protein YbaP (TraB family)
MALAITALLSGGCKTRPAGDEVQALKVTSPAGKSSTLIGSVHAGVEGLREPDVDVLFKCARIYVIENVPGDGPAPEPRKLRYGLVNDKQLLHARWASGLSPIEVQTFERRVQCNAGAALPPNLSASQATLIALSMGDPVSALEIAVRRCSPPGVISRDALLAQAAAAKGLATVGLERPIDVEARRLSVSEDTYAHLLKAALRPGNDVDMQRLVQSLNGADYDQILEVMKAPVPAADAKHYREVMLDDRNHAWMERLRKLVNAGDAVINVGAGHLGGESGLIALLKTDGYTVEPLPLPPARSANASTRRGAMQALPVAD